MNRLNIIFALLQVEEGGVTDKWVGYQQVFFAAEQDNPKTALEGKLFCLQFAVCSSIASGITFKQVLRSLIPSSGTKTKQDQESDIQYFHSLKQKYIYI